MQVNLTLFRIQYRLYSRLLCEERIFANSLDGSTARIASPLASTITIKRRKYATPTHRCSVKRYTSARHYIYKKKVVQLTIISRDIFKGNLVIFHEESGALRVNSYRNARNTSR